jgi:hypothetical protein
MADSILDLIHTNTIFPLMPNWASRPERSFNLNSEYFEYAQSAAMLNLIDNYIHRNMQYGFSLEKADEKTLLDFLYDRKCNIERFWMPIYYKQFRPVSAIVNGTQTIVIEDCGFYEVYSGHERLYIRTYDGTILTRHIMAVVDNGNDTETLTLYSSWDRNIAVSEIIYCSLLVLARVSDEKISMKHISSGMAETTLNFIELVPEYQVSSWEES